MAGYSPTPLRKKLGFKSGFRVCTKNAPDDFCELVAPIPADVTLSTLLRANVDLYHFFTKSRPELERTLPRLMRTIRRNGII
jgi:hypothetical protein